jgi:thiamine-phosphate diphosphorylase
VNDRVDVAVLASAAGVHLGELSIPVGDVRGLLGESMLAGRSVHDLGGAVQAQFDGADYLIAGHVFDTQSKDGQPGRGLDWLEAICDAVQIPVIAIGGIDLGNAAEVLNRGAYGLAMGRGILEASSPEETARKLASMLQ